jgi:hypothetical protein
LPSTRIASWLWSCGTPLRLRALLVGPGDWHGTILPAIISCAPLHTGLPLPETR